MPNGWKSKPGWSVVVVSQSSDACCAITPSKLGRPCRNQAGGRDARLSGDGDAFRNHQNLPMCACSMITPYVAGFILSNLSRHRCVSLAILTLSISIWPAYVSRTDASLISRKSSPQSHYPINANHI
jgi:hypothetical protein